MKVRESLLLLLAAAALTACATIPAGPSVMVWPGAWKPFEVFQADDAVCRQWAGQQAGADLYADDWTLQRRYDNAYMQCMYAKGNQVPGVGRTYKEGAAPPPPPPGYTPPPSIGFPPPSAGGSPQPPPPVESK